MTGWTFAAAGEPDLDRILRLQPEGAFARKLGPSVGVKVVAASLDGTEAPNLLDARVELLDAPVFEGRNGLAFEDVQEPILPLHVRVEGAGAVFQRRHSDADGNWLLSPGMGTPPPADLAQRLGVATPADRARYRRERRTAVEKALRAATDPVERLALELRHSWLAAPGIATGILAAGMAWQAELAGPEPLAEANGLDVEFDTDSPWPLTLWMGIWDADALCGYVQGRLEIPTTSS